MKKIALGRAFALLWLSETAFDIGSALTGFALGVWIFERTGSAEQFSFAILSSTIPAVLALPFSGVLADRFDRRWIIASCDFCATLLGVTLALFLYYDRFEVHHLYLFNAMGSVLGAIRNPAYLAAVSAIVPREKLTQASGLIGIADGMLQGGTPFVAGYLLAEIGLKGIVVVDLVFAVAGAFAVFGALSHIKEAICGTSGDRQLSFLLGMRMSLTQAVDYFRRRKLMLVLVAYVVLQEGLLMLVSAMITPLILSTHPSEVLGLIMSCGAIGGLGGSVFLVVTKLNQRLMIWILSFDAALAFLVLLSGFTTSTRSLCLYAFFALFAGTASEACSGSLWMRKIPRPSQGSVFALLGTVHLIVICVVMLVGGHLGESLFEPALVAGGRWSDSIGNWVGVGKGRGYGFLFIVCGGACFLMSILALLHPQLRRLDELVEDVPELPFDPLLSKGLAV